MGPGLFNGTFYVLQKPLNVKEVTIRLNPVQSGLVDNIMVTEHMEQLKYELCSTGNGLIYHKDHYELVPGQQIHDYQPLINHSNILSFHSFINFFIFKKRDFINIYFIIISSSKCKLPTQPMSRCN